MNSKKINVDFYSPMYSKMKKTIGISMLLVLLIACTSALYIPTKENVSPKADLEQLKEGRALYVNKCSSCHSLYLPEKYKKTQWRKWVDKMAPKAQISNAEKEKIYQYLTKGE